MAAKKNPPTTSSTGSNKSSGSKKTVSTTPVRNSPIPRSTQASTATATETATATTESRRSHQQITQEQIAKRAYEIWRSGKGGSAFENWIRAERELRAQYNN